MAPISGQIGIGNYRDGRERLATAGKANLTGPAKTGEGSMTDQELLNSTLRKAGQILRVYLETHAVSCVVLFCQFRFVGKLIDRVFHVFNDLKYWALSQHRRVVPTR